MSGELQIKTNAANLADLIDIFGAPPVRREDRGRFIFDKLIDAGADNRINLSCLALSHCS